jgi:hypothetical protein
MRRLLLAGGVALVICGACGVLGFMVWLVIPPPPTGPVVIKFPDDPLTPTAAPTSAPSVTSTVITTENAILFVPGQAVMNGRTEGDLVIDISVWDAVPRSRVTCQLPNRDIVEVLDVVLFNEAASRRSDIDDDDSRYYFLVQKGDCRGWVSELFLLSP